MDMELICKDLPKLELHAHLNGSLSRKTLEELGCLHSSITNYNLTTKTDKSLEYCFELFKVAHNATTNTHSVYRATKSVIDEFSSDNVIYLELRTTPRAEENMTRKDYIEAVIQAIQDSESNNILVKLLLSIDRRHDEQTSNETMDLIIKMREKYPDIIKGVDLSGNPTVGSFNDNLFSRARNNNLSISLHCAEVKNHSEVLKMLKFKPDRIGHGTSIHPDYGGSQEIWDLYLQNPIPLECCLTSNVICRTSKSYDQHHVKEWRKYSLPFSLNTDDKGVFDTTLSKELFHAAEFLSLNKMDLWNISYKSIDYTFASSEEKKLLKTKMEKWLEK